MNYQNLLELIILNKATVFYILGIIILLYHVSFLYKLEKFRKKEWIAYAQSQNSSLYKRSWMAMNIKTGLLEGGMTPHPYSYALKHNLVPQKILDGYSVDGSRKCNYF